MPKHGNRMKAEYEAHLNNLHEMISFIQRQSDFFGFDEAQRHNIALACEEALVNIICHGYGGRAGPIEIDCHDASSDGMEIYIFDKGIQFNPLEHVKPPPKNIQVESQKLGGYGIYMIIQLMDKIEYRRENDFNILTLVKYSKKLFKRH